MSFRQDHESGNRAVTLLATCFVMLGGAASCTAIIISTDPAHLEMALIPVGAVMAGIAILLWMLRERPAVSGARTRWSWLGRRRRKVAYHVKPRVPKNERAPAPSGPPTADSIREINVRRSTWVPVTTTRSDADVSKK
jgi:hypothetical protein